MKKFFGRWNAIVLVVACWPGLAAAAPQSFAMSGHGTLLLNVPESWNSSLSSRKADYRRQLVLARIAGPPSW